MMKIRHQPNEIKAGAEKTVQNKITDYWTASGILLLILAFVARYFVFGISYEELDFYKGSFYGLLGLGTGNLVVGQFKFWSKDSQISKFLISFWKTFLFVACFILFSVYIFKAGYLNAPKSETRGPLPLHAFFDRYPEINFNTLIPITIMGSIFYLIYLIRKKTIRQEIIILLLLVISSYGLNLSIANLEGNFRYTISNRLVKVNSEVPLGADYYAEIGKVDDGFVANYSNKMGQFHSHARTHPPFAVLLLWLLSSWGLGSFASSLLVATFASLTVIPVYYSTKELYGHETAIVGSMAFIFVPSVILYSVTCMDVVFMFSASLTSLFFIKTIKYTENRWYPLILAFFYSISLFMTFTVGMLSLSFILIACFDYWYNRNKNIVIQMFITISCVLIIHLLLYLLLDYKVIEVFFKAVSMNELAGDVRRHRLYWIFGGMVDYGISWGLPLLCIGGLYATDLWDKIKRGLSPNAGMYFLGVCLTIMFISGSGLIRKETARVYIIFTPLIVISLSNYLTKLTEKDGKIIYLITGLMFLQAFLQEAFLEVCRG